MSDQNKKSKGLLWLVAGCVMLIVWVIAHQFIPPASELDKMVFAMREGQRAGLVVHLVRVALFMAILLFGWKALVMAFHHKLGVPLETALSAKWRVVGWYLAFESVLMINFTG